MTKKMFSWTRYSNPVDSHAATELRLYIDNDPRYSFRAPGGMGRAVAKNMANKIRKGRYNHDLAAKGWMHVVDAAAKSYSKEFGGVWHHIFNAQTRRAVARDMATDFLRQYEAGEVDV